MSTYAMLLLGFSLLSFTHAYAAVQRPGVLDTIKSGLEYASSYIGIAKDIAELVATSLGHEKQNRGDNGTDQPSKNFTGKKKYFGNQGLMAAFFKLLGLDPTKINAIAVNSAIFLAQMISTAFNLKSKLDRSRGMDLKLDEDQDPLTDDDKWIRGPMQLILDSTNERIQRLVAQAKDENLPRHLVDRIDGLDTDCVRLFVCKAAPVIWAAQNSLRGKGNGSRKWDITTWLPSRVEFEENGDKCEENHTACRLFPES
ncbi:uncharacterized protein LOC124413008 [Diprion similis]|uniref:uncharacterized protein LOC124413008 n=1 Tax=Diprion similis TaxID=362088 RepID=UPI001EF95A27|nr:uncharacterized protein LOC124413008 [Diprion similis]